MFGFIGYPKIRIQVRIEVLLKVSQWLANEIQIWHVGSPFGRILRKEIVFIISICFLLKNSNYEMIWKRRLIDDHESSDRSNFDGFIRFIFVTDKYKGFEI